MSFLSSTEYSRKGSGSAVFEVEGGCTTNYLSTNNADYCVQPYQGEPLADEEWMSADNKERIVVGKLLEILQNKTRQDKGKGAVIFRLYFKVTVKPAQLVLQYITVYVIGPNIPLARRARVLILILVKSCYTCGD